MQDNKKIINKIILRTGKFKQTLNALMLLDTKYSRKSFTKLSSKEIGKLGTTARDLFHFISEIWKAI